MINPTVGRKVWYRPCENDLRGPKPMQVFPGQPLDATVLAVWGDRCVNLLVTDIVGNQFPVLSCTLLQDDDKPKRFSDKDDGAPGPIIGRYAEWMPYQTTQAAKAEARAEETTA